ncbi:zinc-containing alcohol dehydrogenase family protein [Pleurotus pulmonarius]
MAAPVATMKAVVYDKPFEVAVRQVERPQILHPDDIIVRVTTTCICGSDLHMYEGRTAAQPGIIFGHENMGIVDRVGSGVTLLKAGDRVVMPFNVACGRCLNCEEGRSAFCTHVNPGFEGKHRVSHLHLVPDFSPLIRIRSAYGYVAMGPYPGGQAEYVRVPFADFNALLLPPGTAHEEDFALLADIFPTGWHGVELSGFRPGESVVVFGAGPVGLMAAYSAVLRGASDVYVVDRVAERLSKAKDIGCIPIDFSKADAVDQILKLRGGKEVDRGVDAVGYQATSGDGKTEQPNAVLEALIRVVRPTGGLGIPGLYVPSDPGAPDSAAAKGYISFPFGKLFEKGLTLGTGQCNVKTYNRYLRDLIISGRAKPSFVVSHNLPLSEAPSAYHKFDKRIDGYTKVLLHP